jgi:hypothetical protein
LEAEKQNRLAQSRQLAAEAQHASTQSNELALRKAIQAVQRSPTEEARVILAATLEAPLLELVIKHPHDARRAEFSPDGKHLLTTCDCSDAYLATLRREPCCLS